MGDRITKAMPAAVMGKDVPLKEIFDRNHKRYGEGGEFRALYDADADVKKVVDTAIGIEGLKRQWGVHAAGVIMSSAPLQDVIPVMKREQDGAIITQFDYPTCERLGLIKMDFLGLRNLTILDDALINIANNRQEKVVLEDLELTDPATFALLSRGDTLGVFQLDGGPMRALLRSMRPDSFEDISAVGALYRPGPMGADSHNKYARRKNGREPVEALHPELAEALEDVLGETYGLIVYQEQVMAIAQKLAGYTLGQADLLRRAMGKKKKEELDKQFEAFSAGMTERGFSAAAIKALWDTLLPFSDYAFNKAHSAAYGLVTYWTAFLKANYPAEYMAAVLTSVKDDKDKMAIYLNECRRMKIQVLPPDVNESEATFTPVGSDIRFGLSAVRNVGINVVDAIVAARREQGRYTDFADFMDKVPDAGVQQAGDGVADQGRRLRLDWVTAVARSSRSTRRPSTSTPTSSATRRSGRTRSSAGSTRTRGGFGVAIAVPDIADWDKQTLLGHEREMLGLYVSDHPLMGLEHILSASADCTIGQLLRGRGPCRRLDGHGLRADHLGPAQDHQARRRVGDDHRRGPRGRHRRAALPERLPAGQHAAQRGRDRHGQGPALALQGPAGAARPGGQRPRPGRRPVRPGGDHDAVDAVHDAGRRAAQGRARHPPWGHRSTVAADDQDLDHRDEARRPPAGGREPGPVRRPQGAARAALPGGLMSGSSPDAGPVSTAFSPHEGASDDASRPGSGGAVRDVVIVLGVMLAARGGLRRALVAAGRPGRVHQDARRGRDAGGGPEQAVRRGRPLRRDRRRRRTGQPAPP